MSDKYRQSAIEEMLVDPINHSILTEVFDASVGEMIDENISISSVIHALPYDRRTNSIRNLEEEGVIPEGYIKSFKKKRHGRGHVTDWDAMAKDINKNYNPKEPIDTNRVMTQIRDDELKKRRTYREDVYNRGPTGTGITRFAGGMIGSGLDPVNMATMLIPPLYGARNVSRAMYTLSKAKQGVVMGGLSAAAVEPMIYGWKHEIGSEYTGKEALFNIAASAVLNGAVDGIAGNLAHIYNTGHPDDFDKLKKTFMDRGLDEADAESMTYFVYEAAHAPDQKMEAIDFMNRMEGTEEDISVGPVNDDMPTINIEDTDAIEAEYSALPDDLYYLDADEEKVYFRDLDNKYEEQQQRYIELLECLNG